MYAHSPAAVDHLVGYCYVDAFFGTDEEVNMLMQKYIYRKHIMLNKNLQNC